MKYLILSFLFFNSIYASGLSFVSSDDLILFGQNYHGPSQKLNDYQKLRLAGLFYSAGETDKAKPIYNELLEDEHAFSEPLKIENKGGDFYSDLQAILSKQYSCSNKKTTITNTLIKISLEEEDYELAQDYLNQLTNEHNNINLCNSNSKFSPAKIVNYRLKIHLGLNDIDSVLQIARANKLHNSPLYITALELKYSRSQIQDEIDHALQSIEFVPDSIPTDEERVEYYNDGSEVYNISFHDAQASINLFGSRIPLARISETEGENITPSHFITRFKQSNLYCSFFECEEDELQNF
jgi:hypothetical protein